MDYFERYGIPVTLKVDKEAVKKKFYALSRQYHPDFFSREDPAKQEEALQVSADINKAYAIFQHEDKLIRYVLQLKGLLEEEEKYVLNGAFLGEVMDINEGLMELEMAPDAAGLAQTEQDVKRLLDKIYQDVETILENYQENILEKKELLRVKEYYFRKKYLQRILDKIAQIRNIATH